jgi:hypothetical protein
VRLEEGVVRFEEPLELEPLELDLPCTFCASSCRFIASTIIPVTVSVSRAAALSLTSMIGALSLPSLSISDPKPPVRFLPIKAIYVQQTPIELVIVSQISPDQIYSYIVY